MSSAPIRVAIVGGDPVVGRALETLLEGSGYVARFLYELVEDELVELLVDFQILLVVPPLNSNRQRVLQTAVLGSRSPADIAVLRLVGANGARVPAQREDVLFWPCSGKELKRAIDTALISRK